jgi:hypothetical protein
LSVQRIAVFVREDRHGSHAELVRRAKGADRDLASVGDQDLSNHYLVPSRAAFRSVGLGDAAGWPIDAALGGRQ